MEDRSDRARAWEQFKQINDARLKEIGRKGQADPLHVEQLRRLHAALDADGQTADPSPKSEREFASLLRNGAAFGRPGVDGDTPAPADFSERVARLVHNRSPLRQIARVATVDTGTFSLFESQTNAFREIPTHELYAQPKATQKFLDDSRLDAEGWLADKVSDVFARIQNGTFLHGTGVGQPRGLLTYSHCMNWGQVQQVGSRVAGNVTADSLIALHRVLGDEYRKQAGFLMNRVTIQQARELKCPATGHYLWQPGLSACSPDTLLGTPVC